MSLYVIEFHNSIRSKELTHCVYPTTATYFMIESLMAEFISLASEVVRENLYKNR